MTRKVMARTADRLEVLVGPGATADAARRVGGASPLDTVRHWPPEEGPTACWNPLDLSAVLVARRWVRARAIWPRGDQWILAAESPPDDPIVATLVADLVRQPGVHTPEVQSTEGAGASPSPPAIEPHLLALLTDADTDPVALAAAAEEAALRRSVVDPVTLLHKRDSLLTRAGAPDDDPRWGHAAWLWHHLSPRHRARDRLERLLKRARSTGWAERTPELLYGLSQLAIAERSIDDAIVLLDRALVLFRRQDRAHWIARTRAQRWLCENRLGRAFADESLHQALDELPDGHPGTRAQILLAIQGHHVRQGNPDLAMEILQDARQLAETTGSSALLVQVMEREVVLQHRHELGDLATLRTKARDLLWNAAGAGDPRIGGRIHTLRGELAREVGDHDTALVSYQHAERLLSNRLSQVNQALVYLETERHVAARELLEPLLPDLHAKESALGRAVELFLLEVWEARGRADRWESGFEHTLRGLRVELDHARSATRSATLAARSLHDLAAASRAIRMARLACDQLARLGRTRERARLLADARSWVQAGAPVPVGPVHLERPIARGGMGEVWRGWHRELQRPIAVKVLTGAGLGARQEEALRSEVRVLACLSHPGIVQVLDTGVADALAEEFTVGLLPAGSPLLAMEWVDGMPLDDRPLPLTWSETRSVLLQILDALAHAHSADVVHRDLKPANIMTSRAPGGELVVRLVDFGLSALPGNAIAGTPTYMAPEQWSGQPPIPPTDLYALGCIAFVLLTGHPPYEGRTRALQVAHANAPLPQLPRGVAPEGFDAWLKRCLAKHPNDRFPSAARARIVLEGLNDVIHDEPPQLDRVAIDAPSNTFFLDEDAVLPSAPSPTGEVAAFLDLPIPPPPLVPSLVRPSPQGKSLFGLNVSPLIGREAPFLQLWEALASVTGDRGREVVIWGPPGVGVTHLLTWFERRVRELDLAATRRRMGGPVKRRTVILLDDHPNPAPVYPNTLVVRVSDDPTDAICLEPLAIHELILVARSLAPVSADLASEVAHLADGSPKLLTELLRGLIEHDALWPGPAGLRLRDGSTVRLPRATADRADDALTPDPEQAANALVARLGVSPTVSPLPLPRPPLPDDRILRFRLSEQGLANLATRIDAGRTLLDSPWVQDQLKGLGLLTVDPSMDAVGAALELMWHYPVELGVRGGDEMLQRLDDALVAEGASDEDPRWHLLSIHQARQDIIHRRPVGPGLDAALHSGLRPRALFVRGIASLHGGEPDRARSELEEAIDRTEDEVLRLRIQSLMAALRLVPDPLGALAAAAVALEDLGALRGAADAWRARYRQDQRRSSLDRARDAYLRAGSIYGLGAVANEHADLAGDVDDARRATAILGPLRGTVAVNAWTTRAGLEALTGNWSDAAYLASVVLEAGDATDLCTAAAVAACLVATGPPPVFESVVQLLENPPVRPVEELLRQAADNARRGGHPRRADRLLALMQR